MIDILTVLVLLPAVDRSRAISRSSAQPAGAEPAAAEKPPLALTVLVKHSEIDVATPTACCKALPNTPDGYNFAASATSLQGQAEDAERPGHHPHGAGPALRDASEK